MTKTRIYKDGDICGSKFNIWYTLKNGKWIRHEVGFMNDGLK